MDMNKVIINGRITKDPESRMTANGTSVVRFSIALDDYSGKTQFYDCKAWRESADFICRYFKKGDGMLIEGHLDKSTFEARTQKGEAYEKTVTEIVVDRVFFAVGTKSRAGGNLPTEKENTPQSANMAATQGENDTKYNSNEIAWEEVSTDDALPF